MTNAYRSENYRNNNISYCYYYFLSLLGSDKYRALRLLRSKQLQRKHYDDTMIQCKPKSVRECPCCMPKTYFIGFIVLGLTLPLVYNIALKNAIQLLFQRLTLLLPSIMFPLWHLSLKYCRSAVQVVPPFLASCSLPKYRM